MATNQNLLELTQELKRDTEELKRDIQELRLAIEQWNLDIKLAISKGIDTHIRCSLLAMTFLAVFSWLLLHFS